MKGNFCVVVPTTCGAQKGLFIQLEMGERPCLGSWTLIAVDRGRNRRSQNTKQDFTLCLIK